MMNLNIKKKTTLDGVFQASSFIELDLHTFFFPNYTTFYSGSRRCFESLCQGACGQGPLRLNL